MAGYVTSSIFLVKRTALNSYQRNLTRRYLALLVVTISKNANIKIFFKVSQMSANATIAICTSLLSVGVQK